MNNENLMRPTNVLHKLGTRGSTDEVLTPLSFKNLPSSQGGKDRSRPFKRLLENNMMLFISCRLKRTE